MFLLGMVSDFSHVSWWVYDIDEEVGQVGVACWSCMSRLGTSQLTPQPDMVFFFSRYKDLKDYSKYRDPFVGRHHMPDESTWAPRPKACVCMAVQVQTRKFRQ